MSALIEHVLIWRLAIIRALLFAFVGGATAFATSMNGLEWSVLTSTQKILVMLGVFIVVANNLIAFLDRSISRISSGQPPGSDTDRFEKIKL